MSPPSASPRPEPSRRHEGHPRDPGLQPERTALAWARTGLALLVHALLSLRGGMEFGHRGLTLLGVLLMLAAAGVTAYGGWRRHELLRFDPVRAPPAAAMAGVSALTLLAALSAAWAALAFWRTAIA